MYTPVFIETDSARQPFNPTKANMNRYKSLLARILLALMLAAAAMPGLAVAQEAPPRSELSAETLIETARAALAKGELEDAEFLLRGVKPGGREYRRSGFPLRLDRDGTGGLANRHRPVSRHADP